jgi:hypothetical protein
LTDVFAVRLAAELAHQGRVKFSIERLVLVCERHVGHGVLLRATDLRFSRGGL